MPKPVLERNGIKIWRVYDGQQARTYWFTWDPTTTQDGQEHQFDVRDLSTFVDTYIQHEDFAQYKKDIVGYIEKSIDLGEILADGPVSRPDNSITEHRTEVIIAERRARFAKMIEAVQKL